MFVKQRNVHLPPKRGLANGKVSACTRLDEERIAELERKIGQQTMELDFLEKALRRFREQPLPAAANGNAGSMSKSEKRPKRRQR